MADPFTLLQGGDIAGAILSPFTNLLVIGGYNFFYLIVIMTGLGMLYLKNQDYVATGMIGLATAGVTLALLPPILHKSAWILLSISLAVVIYNVVFRRSE